MGTSIVQTPSFELWKTFNSNDHNQVFWARETEHPQQTIVLTKTAGQQPGPAHCCLSSSLNFPELFTVHLN